MSPGRVRIFQPYSDTPEDGFEVLAYDYIEVFAEKFRALAERARPRDLYDVVHLYRNADARPEPQRLMKVLRAKCEFKGIDVPCLADLVPHRAALEAGWNDMLQHQLPALPPAEIFLDTLPEIFDWLQGTVAQPLPAMPIGGDDTLIRKRFVDLGIGSQRRNHIELIRFAAANRLVVEIDYRDKQGKLSTREIEAYSLRRSRAGEVLLMAVRVDSSQPRSYLVNSILGVKATHKSFAPRYPIELTPTGIQRIPRTARGHSGSPFAARRKAPVRRIPVRNTTRSTNSGLASNPTYVFKCTVCGKIFNKKSYDSTLNKHKNRLTGYECYGMVGTFVRMKY